MTPYARRAGRVEKMLEKTRHETHDRKRRPLRLIPGALLLLVGSTFLGAPAVQAERCPAVADVLTELQSDTYRQAATSGPDCDEECVLLKDGLTGYKDIWTSDGVAANGPEPKIRMRFAFENHDCFVGGRYSSSWLRIRFEANVSCGVTATWHQQAASGTTVYPLKSVAFTKPKDVNGQDGYECQETLPAKNVYAFYSYSLAGPVKEHQSWFSASAGNRVGTAGNNAAPAWKVSIVPST